MRVHHVEEPDEPGDVLDVEDRDILVRWPNGEKEWCPVEELRRYDVKPKQNPPQFEAPEIQHLEMVTRLDPETGLVEPVRDDEFVAGEAGPIVTSPQALYECFKGMGSLDQEQIVVAMFNVRGELTGWKIVHKGHLAAVEASPRKMFQDAILSNAHSIAMLHSHPSGDPSPSGADEELTEHVVKIGEMLEIPLWEHLVVGRERDGQDQPYYSFRDAGLIPVVEDDGS